MIPAVWFVRLMATTGSLDARQQLAGAMATAHGIAMAMAGEKERMRVQAATRRLQRAAAPLVYDDVPDDET